MAALRVLAILPEPVEAAWSPLVAGAWASLQPSLAAVNGSLAIELERLAPATANALSERIEREPFDVVHLIGRGSSRPLVKHGTFTLEGSDRRARDLNAQNFARLCAGIRELRLVVVQPLGAPTELDVLCDAIVQQAAPVVLLAAGDGAESARARAEFIQVLYLALAAGKDPEEAFAAAQSHLPVPMSAAATLQPGEARLLARAQRPRAAESPRPSRAATPSRGANPSTAAPVVAPLSPVVTNPMAGDERASMAKRQIESKRAAGAFDVFLCHNVSDKPAVIEIAQRLMAGGILPWLDQWELRPGMPWQRLLENQIAKIHAAAVFVGREGIGPWQRQELDGFLREFNTRGCPVIPVMLPGSSGEPELPLFLRGMTWVDFRVKVPDPLARLLWGITGERGF
jgi:hypothetical protein